jgi:hypothetical protein
MEQGKAADHLIFGTKRVIAYPGKVRNGKEWEAFRDHPDNVDALIVTRSELAESEAIATAVKNSPAAMRVLRGEFQKEIFWTFCGRQCVSHLDVFGPRGAFVTELKISNSSNPARFRWQALKMYYHCQLAFYGDAAQSVSGHFPKAFFIVCIGSTFPHVVTVFRLTPKAIILGQKMNRLWFERLLQCEQAGSWPGYSQTVVELDGPDDEWLESQAIPF